MQIIATIKRPYPQNGRDETFWVILAGALCCALIGFSHFAAEPMKSEDEVGALLFISVASVMGVLSWCYARHRYRSGFLAAIQDDLGVTLDVEALGQASWQTYLDPEIYGWRSFGQEAMSIAEMLRSGCSGQYADWERALLRNYLSCLPK